MPDHVVSVCHFNPRHSRHGLTQKLAPMWTLCVVCLRARHRNQNAAGSVQIVIVLDPSGDFPGEEFDRGCFAFLELHDGPRIVVSNTTAPTPGVILAENYALVDRRIDCTFCGHCFVLSSSGRETRQGIRKVSPATSSFSVATTPRSGHGFSPERRRPQARVSC